MVAAMGLTGAPAGQNLVGTSVGASGAALPHPAMALANGGMAPGDVYHPPLQYGGGSTTPFVGTRVAPATAPTPAAAAPVHSLNLNTGDVGQPTPTSFFPTTSPSPTTVPTALKPATQTSAPTGLDQSVPPRPNESGGVQGGPGTAGTPPAFTSPNGAQTAPAVGTPTGYNISQGIDTSVQSFMPTGVNAGTFQNIPLSETKGPAPQTYINSAEGQVQGPTQWNVTAPQTVAGQYANLMSKGNPAIQAAEESTIRANAASGGRNSLMAQNAATLAGSQVALSIASQDAQTQAQSGQYNANAANTFAQNMNQFVESMTSNQQSFDLGYAQLANQFNTNMATMYGQVVQGAAAASENVKQSLDTTQASVNSTMETMDKTFSQNVAETEMSNQFTNENAWTNYGMQVRASYLSSVNQQQTALMQTIASINANPNINSTQAAAGIQSAVSQFNSFMTMNNAYYSSMVPDSNTATYQAYDPNGWPNN